MLAREDADNCNRLRAASLRASSLPGTVDLRLMRRQSVGHNFPRSAFGAAAPSGLGQLGAAVGTQRHVPVHSLSEDNTLRRRRCNSCTCIGSHDARDRIMRVRVAAQPARSGSSSPADHAYVRAFSPAVPRPRDTAIVAANGSDSTLQWNACSPISSLSSSSSTPAKQLALVHLFAEGAPAEDSDALADPEAAPTLAAECRQCAHPDYHTSGYSVLYTHNQASGAGAGAGAGPPTAAAGAFPFPVPSELQPHPMSPRGRTRPSITDFTFAEPPPIATPQL